MVKKRSSFAQHGPYLAIVAVVAVVAIVFLILNFAGVSPVGEAGRFAVRTTTAPAAPNTCVEGERCGFVTKDEVTKMITGSTGEKQVFVFSKDITAFYNGKYDWQKTSGEKVCKDMGYNGCFAAEFTDETLYRSSVDGSCGGNVQLSYRYEWTGPCDWSGLQNTPCEKDSGFYLPGTDEPEKGDRMFMPRKLTNVICIE